MRRPHPGLFLSLIHIYLLMCLIIVVVLAFVLMRMHPEGKDIVSIDPKLLADEESAPLKKAETPAEKLENSWILSLLSLIHI